MSTKPSYVLIISMLVACALLCSSACAVSSRDMMIEPGREFGVTDEPTVTMSTPGRSFVNYAAAGSVAGDKEEGNAPAGMGGDEGD